MNNNQNGVNQPPAQQYYQPPNYYQQYGYNGNNGNNGNPAPGGFYPQKQPYTQAAETSLGSMNIPLFLILSIIFGWICSRTLLVGRVGAGMTVMGVLFYAFFLPFILHKQNKKIPLSAWLLFIPQIAVFASFTLYAGAMNKVCGLLVSLAIVMVQTTLIAGCTEGRPFTRELLTDVGTTYLAYPFMNMWQTVKSVFGIGKHKSGEKKNKVGSKILLGLLISVPVVIILIIMLSHADEMFSRWITWAIRMLNISLGRILADIILTAIVMLYVMPLVVTLRSGYHAKYNESPVNRPLDAVIVTTVLFAASLVYLLFVAVQFTYLFASSQSLPVGYTYAEYCRRGFFELVMVTAITTIILAVVSVFTTRNDKEQLPAYTKAALLLISACDCVMIVSAAYRLVIYVREYDMTVSRFNAGVVIAFMAVCIVVMALKLIFEKMKVSAVIGGALITMMALYSVFNVDGFVARYNIDRYISGQTQKLDTEYIKYHLSIAAIPELERLVEQTSNQNDKDDLRCDIAAIASDYGLTDDYHVSPAKWTVDYFRAKKVVDALPSYSEQFRYSDSDGASYM